MTSVAISSMAKKQVLSLLWGWGLCREGSSKSLARILNDNDETKQTDTCSIRSRSNTALAAILLVIDKVESLGCIFMAEEHWDVIARFSALGGSGDA